MPFENVHGKNLKQAVSSICLKAHDNDKQLN